MLAIFTVSTVVMSVGTLVMAVILDACCPPPGASSRGLAYARPTGRAGGRSFQLSTVRSDIGQLGDPTCYLVRGRNVPS